MKPARSRKPRHSARVDKLWQELEAAEVQGLPAAIVTIRRARYLAAAGEEASPEVRAKLDALNAETVADALERTFPNADTRPEESDTFVMVERVYVGANGRPVELKPTDRSRIEDMLRGASGQAPMPRHFARAFEPERGMSEPRERELPALDEAEDVKLKSALAVPVNRPASPGTNTAESAEVARLRAAAAADSTCTCGEAQRWDTDGYENRRSHTPECRATRCREARVALAERACRCGPGLPPGEHPVRGCPTPMLLQKAHTLERPVTAASPVTIRDAAPFEPATTVAETALEYAERQHREAEAAIERINRPDAPADESTSAERARMKEATLWPWSGGK